MIPDDEFIDLGLPYLKEVENEYQIWMNGYVVRNLGKYDSFEMNKKYLANLIKASIEIRDKIYETT